MVEAAVSRARETAFHRGLSVLFFAAVIVVSTVAANDGRDTYATLSDRTGLGGNRFRAAVWATPPAVPTACAHLEIQHVFVLSDDGDVEWIGEEAVAVDGDGAFHGTDENDLISNIGGRRTIHGLAGNDCLVAGSAGDQMHSGTGDDVLLGDEGEDKLHGFFGDNLLDGEAGRDVCAPGPGRDTMVDCEAPGLSNEPSVDDGVDSSSAAHLDTSDGGAVTDVTTTTTTDGLPFEGGSS